MRATRDFFAAHDPQFDVEPALAVATTLAYQLPGADALLRDLKTIGSRVEDPPQAAQARAPDLPVPPRAEVHDAVDDSMVEFKPAEVAQLEQFCRTLRHTRMAALESIDLDGRLDSELKDRFLGALAAALHEGRLPALRRLSLLACCLTHEDWLLLGLLLPFAPQLEGLRVGMNMDAGDRGAVALAAGLSASSSSSARLKTLMVLRSDIGPAGMRALAAALPALPGLVEMELGRNRADGPCALLPPGPAVQRIDVTGLRMDAASTLALVRAAMAQCPELRALLVGGNGADGAAAQAVAEGLAGTPLLEELDLNSSPELGDAGVVAIGAALAELPGLPLQLLALADVGMGDAGVTALAGAAAALPALDTFSVARNAGVTDAGFQAVVSLVGLSGTLRSLVGMGLAGITDASFTALTEALCNAPSVQEVRMGRCAQVSAAAVEGMKEALEGRRVF